VIRFPWNEVKELYLDVKIYRLPGKTIGHRDETLFSAGLAAAFLFNGGDLW
jgi:hypothetical protein